MSNSPLVCYTKLSPHNSGRRLNTITKITPHHAAGRLSIESMGSHFANPATQASSNYGVGNDGRIAMYVEECNRAWTSYSKWNDNRAVTFEVVNESTGGEWPISKAAWKGMIDLMVDICKRNPGIKRANGERGVYYDGTKNASLTFHEMFRNTNCPGPYIKKRAQQICDEVNARLDVELDGENEGGLTMGQYEELKGMIQQQADTIARQESEISMLKDVAAHITDISGTGNIPSDWAAPACGYAVNKGIFSGGENNDFGWQKPVTREQLAQVIFNTFATDNTGDKHAEWSTEAITVAKNAGLFNGDGEGNFGWTKPVTREELAAVIVKAMNLLNNDSAAE